MTGACRTADGPRWVPCPSPRPSWRHPTPWRTWTRRQASEAKRTRDLFAVQLRLGDLEGCVGFIAGHSTAGAYGAADNPALGAVLGQLPPERTAALLTAVIAGNVPRLPGACAGLLVRCAQQADPARLAELRAPALALLEGLPDGREAPPLPNWERPESLTPAQIADAMTGFARIDGAIADRAVGRFLALPALYDLDRLLLPAALLLKEAGTDPEPPAVARLRQAVLVHLEARIALPLDPPSDWTRASEVPCGCAHCRGLSLFLASPSEPVWHFKAAESDRSHMAHTVSRAKCDLDLTTDKRGRPYTLVCTKNQASFERRVAQRAQDLGHRDRLSA